MIDFNTYQELHPGNKYTTVIGSKDARLGDYLTATEDALNEPNIYLFPAMIPGFDLRRKKWSKYISIVELPFTID